MRLIMKIILIALAILIGINSLLMVLSVTPVAIYSWTTYERRYDTKYMNVTHGNRTLSEIDYNSSTSQIFFRVVLVSGTGEQMENKFVYVYIYKLNKDNSLGDYVCRTGNWTKPLPSIFYEHTLAEIWSCYLPEGMYTYKSYYEGLTDEYWRELEMWVVKTSIYDDM